MQRLEETADDAHLQPAQQLEEKLGSVDYDVWACSACSFVDTKRYGAWFTRYPAYAQASCRDYQEVLTAYDPRDPTGVGVYGFRAYHAQR